MKEKKIKAWLPLDGLGKPLCLNALGDSMMETVIFVHANKEAAEKAWHPWNVAQCTITYPLPAKRKHK